ncbi:hypothetical protein OEZ86_005304 [Tetradesmus obliquus]|nr:hypothetical protein OEZ86_005304 [Tetradesmus obliquus]
MVLTLVALVTVLSASLPRLGLAQCTIPPTFNLNAATAPDLCLGTGDNTIWAEFTHTMRGVNGRPVFTASVDGQLSCVETYERHPSADPATTNPTLTYTTVYCSRAGNAAFAPGPHDITLKVSYEGFFPCGGGVAISTARARVQLAYGGELQLAAVLNGNIPCAAVVNSNGGGTSRSVTVTCSSTDAAAFPAGSHSVTLTAAAADPMLSGCAAPRPIQLSTSLEVFATPKLQLRPVAMQQIACRSSRAVTMRFSYVVRDGGSRPILSNPRAIVNVPGIRPGALRVTCTPTLRATTAFRGQLATPGLALRNSRVAADCAGGTDVGRVNATCIANDLMQVQIISRKVDEIRTQLFYFGCAPPRETGCPGNDWIGVGPSTDIDDRLRSSVIVIETLDCSCSRLYWAAYELGNFRGLGSNQC